MCSIIFLKINCRALGNSEDSIHKLAVIFYEKLFDDPILCVFFVERDKKHAERLTWFLLYVMDISDKYMEERHSLDTVEVAHYMSKFYQERLSAPPGAGCPGGNYTNSQVKYTNYYSISMLDSNSLLLIWIKRIAWKKHFLDSCVEVAGLKGELLQDISDFVDRSMEAYGPFDDDRK